MMAARTAIVQYLVQAAAKDGLALCVESCCCAWCGEWSMQVANSNVIIMVWWGNTIKPTRTIPTHDPNLWERVRDVLRS